MIAQALSYSSNITQDDFELSADSLDSNDIITSAFATDIIAIVNSTTECTFGLDQSSIAMETLHGLHHYYKSFCLESLELAFGN